MIINESNNMKHASYRDILMRKASLPHPLRTTRSQIFFKRFENMSEFKNHLMLEPSSCKLHELRREYCARKGFRHFYRLETQESPKSPAESPEISPSFRSLSPALLRAPPPRTQGRRLNIHREIHRIQQLDRKLFKTPIIGPKPQSPMILEDEGSDRIRRSKTDLRAYTPVISKETSRNLSPSPKLIQNKLEDIYSLCDGFMQNLQKTRRIGKRTQNRLKGKLKFCSKKIDNAIYSSNCLPEELVAFKHKMNELRKSKGKAREPRKTSAEDHSEYKEVTSQN